MKRYEMISLSSVFAIPTSNFVKGRVSFNCKATVETLLNRKKRNLMRSCNGGRYVPGASSGKAFGPRELGATAS